MGHVVTTIATFLVGLTPLASSAEAAGVASTAPTNIVATAASASIIVTWAAPAYLGDGIVNYSVDYSTDGSSWTNSSTTIASSARTYTINSLTPGTPYYIRMRAINGAGSSPYGYPWTKLYSTSVTQRDTNGTALYDTGSGIGVSDTATTLTNAGATFTRVKYHMQYDVSGVTSYSDADMAKWNSSSVSNASGSFTSPAATIAYLRIPDVNTANTFNQFTLQTNVQDLTVVSSLSSINASGKTGRLEIWPWNYVQGLSGLSPSGSATTYDYDDQAVLSAGYGSFQVHNVSDGVTILAWNNQGNGLNPDLGIGSSTGAHPDWTFCAPPNTGSYCGSRTNFHVEISINIPATPTALLTTAVSLTSLASAIFRTSTPITATASTSGKVTFYANGKRIPGCINVATASISPYTATCNWKSAQHSPTPITATFTPNLGLQSTASAIKPIVSSRSGNR
jgi:hypothetical protein